MSEKELETANVTNETANLHELKVHGYCNINTNNEIPLNIKLLILKYTRCFKCNNKNYISLKCANCGGDGYCVNWDYCETCDGTGWFNSRVQCKICNGSGIYGRNGADCWRCDGTGIYDRGAFSDDCRACTLWIVF